MILPFTDNSGCPCSKGPQHILLPVAPRANHKIRFAEAADLKAAIPPYEAPAKLNELCEQGVSISELEINGPGDPLTAIQPTMETLSILRTTHPSIPLSLSTLGIGGELFVPQLTVAGLSRLYLRIDTLDPDTASSLYQWIRPATKTIPLDQAIEILLKEQNATMHSCQTIGLAFSVRTMVYPGINDVQITEIAKLAANNGADSMMLIPFVPEKGREDCPPSPSREILVALRDQCARYLPVSILDDTQMGYIMERTTSAHLDDLLPKPIKERPNVAVVSSNGMDIDLHLGQAIRILIYGPRTDDGLPSLLEARPAPEPGSSGERWETLADSLADCFALLATSAGERPRRILAQKGITVLLTEDNVEGTVDVLYGGKKKGKNN